MQSRLLQKIQNRFCNRDATVSTVAGVVYWFLVLVYLELLLHLVAFGAPDLRFCYVVGFDFVFACVLALLTTFLTGKLQRAAMLVLTLTATVLYGSQMVFYFVFGSLYTVSQIQQGGAAITSFWKETLVTVGKHLPWIFTLFVPTAAWILLQKFCRRWFDRSNAAWRCVVIAAAVLVQLLSLWGLRIGGTSYFSNYYFYHNNSATTDQTTERFGLLTAFRLDIMGDGDSNLVIQPEETYYVPEETSVPETTAPEADKEPGHSVYVPKVEYNVLNIDFEALNAVTEDAAIQALNTYCDSLIGTNKNKYTGMLSDYNLIVLCAEAFSPAAIDEELTPTLYRLANEGIIFNNYYNTYPNNTIDGEYTLCMGLYPDSTRGKDASSFYASRNSMLPFCLGNVFKNQRGIQSYGYHNYDGGYYYRYASHPNMGYSMKFANSGMQFTTDWPSSDLEMMQQSVDDYITADEQFHAYYMTFSGHLVYDRYSNPMAARNWDAVKDLEYSDEAKCYLSCHIELEKALEYLMQRLEEAGVAEKTAIVLAADHFPYGLTDGQYSELVDYEVDEFSKQKSTLIFWVGGLEETIVVDEYCCNADILPTILNLWGFEYDSRMLAGTDVFSLDPHIAILRDKSFLTDKVWVNASTGEIRYMVDEGKVPANYVENMIKLVETKISVSEAILNKSYYKFVFETGASAVQSANTEPVSNNE